MSPHRRSHRTLAAVRTNGWFTMLCESQGAASVCCGCTSSRRSAHCTQCLKRSRTTRPLARWAKGLRVPCTPHSTACSSAHAASAASQAKVVAGCVTASPRAPSAHCTTVRHTCRRTDSLAEASEPAWAAAMDKGVALSSSCQGEAALRADCSDAQPKATVAAQCS